MSFASHPELFVVHFQSLSTPRDSNELSSRAWLLNALLSLFIVLLVLLAPLFAVPLHASGQPSFLIPSLQAAAQAPLEPQLLHGLSPHRPLSSLLAKQWTVDHGLPSNTLIDVIRTPDGFLWISSFDGLVRFDGMEFEVINKSAHLALNTNAFIRFFEDSEQNLWVGTQGNGVWQVRNGEISPYLLDHIGIIALDLLIDAEQTVWLGMDTGLFKRPAGREKFSKVQLPGLDQTRVRALKQDDQGVIWIASEGDGLGRLQGSSFRWLTPKDGLAGQDATSLAFQDGKLWIGTLNGLSILDQDGLRTIEETDGFALNAVELDDYGNLWATSTQGLIRINADSGHIETSQDLHGVSLRDLSQIDFDSEGNIWITSVVNGLIQLRPSLFQTISRADGLATDRINTVLEQDSGALLIGLDRGAVQRVQNGEVSDFPLTTQLPDVRIRDLTIDRAGRLWISSHAGLLRIEHGRETLFTMEDGLPTNHIRMVFEDSKERFWIATRTHGLTWMNDRDTPSFRVLDEHDGLPESFIFSIKEAPNGELALASGGGLALLTIHDASPGQQPEISVRSYRDPDSLPGLVVFNVLMDAAAAADSPTDNTDSSGRGGIWLATDGGLGRLQGEQIFKLQKTDGLPVDGIFDVQRDSQGNLWMTSSMGILRASEAALLEFLNHDGPFPHFRVFTTHDGMAHRQCTAATPFTQSRDGRLLFPTLGGLSILDPSNLSHNPIPLPIVIRDVLVDGARIAPQGLVEIDPDARRIAFSFAGLTHVRPEKAELWYRLEGFDDQWLPAGAERQALYTNLDPGKYRFHVVGANSDGVWNQKGASQELILKAHFFESPWVISILILGLLLFAQQVVFWRLRVVRRRGNQLQEIVDRQRLVAAQNDQLIRELEAKNQEIEARGEELERFTYTVSHDLKSPLVTIRGFAGALQEDIATGDRERIDEDLRLIMGASERMERLLRELLSLSQIGRLNNPPEEVSMSDIARKAAALTAGQVQNLGAILEIQPNMPSLFVDRSRIIEVFQNLIDNALKFYRPGTKPKISIGCEWVENEPIFFVTDDGIGIEPKHSEQIFGLFKRLNPATEGTGVGLAIVKRTIKNHGGRIWVESAGLGSGTTVKLTLVGLSPDQEPQ